jgi:hypothetical protein
MEAKRPEVLVCTTGLLLSIIRVLSSILWFLEDRQTQKILPFSLMGLARYLITIRFRSIQLTPISSIHRLVQGLVPRVTFNPKLKKQRCLQWLVQAHLVQVVEFFLLKTLQPTVSVSDSEIIFTLNQWIPHKIQVVKTRISYSRWTAEHLPRISATSLWALYKRLEVHLKRIWQHH